VLAADGTGLQSTGTLWIEMTGDLDQHRVVDSRHRGQGTVAQGGAEAEITKSDAFTYDLNLLGGSPDVASTASISGADPKVAGKLVQSNSGTFNAFYGDEHIQALLKAMQSKNYGRVLAKPKVLVNDNRLGFDRVPKPRKGHHSRQSRDPQCRRFPPGQGRPARGPLLGTGAPAQPETTGRQGC